MGYQYPSEITVVETVKTRKSKMVNGELVETSEQMTITTKDKAGDELTLYTGPILKKQEVN